VSGGVPFIGGHESAGNIEQIGSRLNSKVSEVFANAQIDSFRF
jgi:Zn-dependent alcohol dehydrogenase